MSDETEWKPLSALPSGFVDPMLYIDLRWRDASGRWHVKPGSVYGSAIGFSDGGERPSYPLTWRPRQAEAAT